VKGMLTGALPVFDIKSKGKGKENENRAALAAAPPVKGFDFAAAGMKPPTIGDQWQCSECDCLNDPKLKKCYVCEHDRE